MKEQENIQKAVTLNDIADKLNVSTATVSKALRNQPDISESMKARIKDIADELGYTPNLIARNLSAGQSKTLGLVVPKVAHYFFGSIIEHVYNAAYEKGYEVLLTVSQENEELEKKQIQRLLSMQVDGMLISISRNTRDSGIFDTVIQRGVPLVFIDRAPAIKNINAVTVNDYLGAYKAVEHAIKLGYTKIAHFAGSPDINIGCSRKQGFIDAMAKYNIEIKPSWIVEGGFDEESGYKAFMNLYESGNLPQFIFAVTYPVALGIYRAASELGLSIPYDVDLICFGNAKAQTFLKPALSCVDQPTDLLAYRAIEVLLSIIEGDGGKDTRHEIIETDMIIRSTALMKNQANYVA